MKPRIFLFIGMLLLSFSIVGGQEAATENKTPQPGSMKVFASPDLVNLVQNWANEYSGLNPQVQIEVIQCEDQAVSGLLDTGAGIEFISGEFYTAIKDQSAWKVVVGRDIIVPVMNAANPLLEEIYQKGISPEGLSRILENPEKESWGMLLGNQSEISTPPVHYYITNDASILPALAKFLDTDGFISKTIQTVNGPELISAIQKDPLAFGFCNLDQVVDRNNQRMAEQIKLVPIDNNGNGKIDYMEDIYENLQSFTRGVWIGKYPKAFSGKIYSVSSGKPENEAEVAFLQWILADGQQFLSANGHSDLVPGERLSQLEKFNEPAIYATIPIHSINTVLAGLLLALVIIIITGAIMNLVFRRIKNNKSVVLDSATHTRQVFDEDTVIIPKGLFFDKTHTWAFMKKDGLVKIGIDDFLQHVTGTITRVEMKNAGEKIKKGDQFLTLIRKGKQLKIYSPVSGTITAQNKTLITNSSLLNSAPYSGGWVYLIEPANWIREIQFLTMAGKYKTWLKDEFSRLKDFFACTFKDNTTGYAQVAMQDGGALKDKVLADLGPEIWEDFQTRFIDAVR